MTGLKTWLMGLMLVSMALSMLLAITPKGKYQTILRFSGGLALILVTVQPLLRADWSGLGQSLIDWGQEITAQTESLEENQQEELSRIIAEKTGAYIQKKAEALGFSCEAAVMCEEREGISVPTEVTLSVPFHRELSRSMAEELDIPVERQHWQEG